MVARRYKVWVPLPQGFSCPSPPPPSPFFGSLIKHNKNPWPLPNKHCVLTFPELRKGWVADDRQPLLSPTVMNYLKELLATAGYREKECVRLLARAYGPFLVSFLP